MNGTRVGNQASSSRRRVYVRPRSRTRKMPTAGLCAVIDLAYQGMER